MRPICLKLDVCQGAEQPKEDQWISLACCVAVPASVFKLATHCRTSGLLQVKQHIGPMCVTAVEQNTSSIVTCSQQFTTLTGYEAAELTGHNCLALTGPATNSSSLRHLMSAQVGSKRDLVNMLLYKKDGSPFWALVASTPLFTGQDLAGGAEQQTLQLEQERQQQQQQQQQEQDQTWHCIAAPHLLLVVDINAMRPRRIGKYILGKVLGQGASGMVRLGRHTGTGE
jgi:PAS domain S-box-containing protein